MSIVRYPIEKPTERVGPAMVALPKSRLTVVYRITIRMARQQFPVLMRIRRAGIIIDVEPKPMISIRAAQNAGKIKGH